LTTLVDLSMCAIVIDKNEKLAPFKMGQK
jgi:hypothetical protein